MKPILFEEHQKSHWTEEEQSNVKVVIGFMQTLMNEHDFDKVRSNFFNSKYLQHNRSIPDGMEGLLKYVKDLVKRFPEYSYDVKHIHADGDRVIFHSHITTSRYTIWMRSSL